MPDMNNNRRSASKQHATRWYGGANVPKAVIRRFAQEVVKRFHPQKIVLFGSHAYGKPHADSDVDILVVMPARNQLDQAVRISLAIDPPFPLDIIVRTPHSMKWRLAEGDSLLREIIAKGKVLHEASDGPVGAKGRGRLSRGGKARGRKSSTACTGDTGRRMPDATGRVLGASIDRWA